MAKGSSPPSVISVSTVSIATPDSADPFKVNGFSVSKLPCTGRVKLPPLGAFGVT